MRAMQGENPEDRKGESQAEKLSVGQRKKELLTREKRIKPKRTFKFTKMAVSLPSSFFFFPFWKKNTVPILPIWFVMVVLTFEYAPKPWTMIGRQKFYLGTKLNS